jgi:hypothetical protein
MSEHQRQAMRNPGSTRSSAEFNDVSDLAAERRSNSLIPIVGMIILLVDLAAVVITLLMMR